MASVIAAVRSKYDNLTVSNFPDNARPTLYFGEAPVVVGGVQIFPPYVVLLDNGLGTQYEFESNVIETTGFAWEVYYDTLEDVDSAVEAIKYNGGGVTGRLGFDFGTLTGLYADTSRLEIVRTGEQRTVAGVGKTGQRIHMCRLSYNVVLQRS